MSAKKLNLGCGTAHIPGYINVDFFTPADLKHDLREPLPYDDDSIDEIKSVHNVEHFTRAEWEKIRLDWYRVLKPGGKLVIDCPNMAYVCKMYLEQPDDSFWRITMYGIQDHAGEFHKNGFDRHWLAKSFPDMTVTNVFDDDQNLHMEFRK